ncbi:hypothetical protein RB608_09680 [Nocardioides sp. LHD-245]|uniref:hypothetical protein n=1 Tax=Nocardioides sp. LHD-245 TaxID=3051387 RepID=UPI0027DFE4EF|nr:hypothetical protein [Nocardioides sp. LHD-245]
MDGEQDQRTARVSVLVAGLAAALVAALTSSLIALSADAPLATAVAMLAVAAAGLVRTAAGGVLVLRPAAWPGARQPVPTLAARVADPVRHPVRPRAPGRA